MTKVRDPSTPRPRCALRYLWAARIHPAHPQLIDGSWLPAHWLQWARSQGRPPALEA